MMKEVALQVLTILSPAHNTEENISLPETYQSVGYTGSMIYEGDIPCGASIPTKLARKDSPPYGMGGKGEDSQ